MNGVISNAITELNSIAVQRSDLYSNRRLSELPREDRARLQFRMRTFDVIAGDELYPMDSLLTDVYFPVTAVVSLFYGRRTGASSQLVGNEGFVGVDYLFGAARTECRAVVSQPGRLIAVQARLLASQVQLSAVSRTVLLRYAHTYFTQATRELLCAQHRSLEQRLCDRLLLQSDRALSRESRISLRDLGETLCVRRQAVTDAMTQLGGDGIVEYHRGRVVILNRPALEDRACECHLTGRRRSRGIIAPDVNVRRSPEPLQNRVTRTSAAPA